VRTIAEIRSGLDEAFDRRAEIWHELGEGVDPGKSAEAKRLSSLIEDLWAEARAAQARSRFGSPDLIHARARAEERLERDARRKAA
jgi:HEAT repeat protein